LLISPEQVGEPIRRDAVSARGEQDLQDLFWASAPEITRAERPRAVLDFKRAEQTDHRAALTTAGVVAHWRFERDKLAAHSCLRT
jgi:hypothetical protein